MKKYFKNLLIALDQLLNTIFNGAPDETVSSRWGRAERRGDSKIAHLGCAVLDKLDQGHCEDSIEYDEKGDPIPHHLPLLEGGLKVGHGAVNAEDAGSTPAPPANTEAP